MKFKLLPVSPIPCKAVTPWNWLPELALSMSSFKTKLISTFGFDFITLINPDNQPGSDH